MEVSKGLMIVKICNGNYETEIYNVGTLRIIKACTCISTQEV